MNDPYKLVNFVFEKFEKTYDSLPKDTN